MGGAKFTRLDSHAGVLPDLHSQIWEGPGGVDWLARKGPDGHVTGVTQLTGK